MSTEINKNEDVAIPLVSSRGECNIPAYFQSDASVVEACNYDLAKDLFKYAIVINLAFSLLFFKNLSTTFMAGFVIFHIFLYFFITRLFVEVSMGEWRTYQAYKYAVKKDPDFSRFDTPLSQFKSITSFLLNQPINRQNMIYFILVVSLFFVWLPIMFNINSEDARFDLSELRKKLPF
jgi:hypothetical protein